MGNTSIHQVAMPEGGYGEIASRIAPAASSAVREVPRMRRILLDRCDRGAEDALRLLALHQRDDVQPIAPPLRRNVLDLDRRRQSADDRVVVQRAPTIFAALDHGGE